MGGGTTGIIVKNEKKRVEGGTIGIIVKNEKRGGGCQTKVTK